MVPEQDGGALVAALLEVCGDRAFRERAGKRSRERIEQELTWTHVASRYLAAYERALALRNAHA